MRRAAVTLLDRDGGPQEKAVAQPHGQAARAAPIGTPALQRLPAVPQPAPAAPGVPRVRPLRRPRSRGSRLARARARPRSRRVAPRWRRVAVPVEQATAGSSRRSSPSTATAPTSARPRSPRAPRSPPRAGARVILFGPAAELGEPPPGVRGRRRAASRSRRPRPGQRGARDRDASIVQAAPAVADGPRAGARVRRRHRRRRSRPGSSTSSATRGIYRPALALPLPVPGRPVTLLDVGANAAARREHLVQFAFMGAALASTVSASSARASGCSPTARRPSAEAALVVEAHGEPSERDRRRQRRHSSSSATSRATTCSRARSTSSSPTASPATSR